MGGNARDLGLHNSYSAPQPRLASGVSSSTFELDPNDLGRFLSYVRKGRPSECWLWSGSAGGTKGWEYGSFWLNGEYVKAHRLAYVLANGAIPRGHVVAHHCDRPLCCNPAHLFACTQGDNLRDAASKNRFNVPRPNRRKLNDDQIAAFFDLRAAGSTLQEIGDRFGVTKSFVSFVLRGKRRVYTAPKLQDTRKAG